LANAKQKNYGSTEDTATEGDQTDGQEGLLESDDEEYNIFNRHEWQFKQQHRKGYMDFVDGTEEGVGVAKRKSKICAQSILEHLRKYPCTPLTNVVNTVQWLNDDRFVLINESHKKFQDAKCYK
jgi:glucan phosphorylase